MQIIGIKSNKKSIPFLSVNQVSTIIVTLSLCSFCIEFSLKNLKSTPLGITQVLSISCSHQIRIFSYTALETQMVFSIATKLRAQYS